MIRALRSKTLKRAFDLAGAAAGLILSMPIFLPVAALVRWKLGPPILFRQERAGLHGKTFAIYKFRTMRDAVDEQGRPLPDEERLTPFGEWLRTTSFDELPGLFNVLKGDMSLVGPRPLLVEYLPRYSLEQRRRHDVMPGLTGWTAVSGRNLLPWPEKFKLDLWYVDNWDLWLDTKILFMTAAHLWRREGIQAPGHATTPHFRGETDETDGGEPEPHDTGQAGASR